MLNDSSNCPPTQEQINNAVLDMVKNSLPPGFLDGNTVISEIRRRQQTLIAVQSFKCPASSTTIKDGLDELIKLNLKPDESIPNGLLSNPSSPSSTT